VAQNWNTEYGNTNHVLMPFGQDFRYKNAERWFSNIDKLIEVIHETHPEVNIFYSTPSCYISLLNKMNHTFGNRDMDYFEERTGYYSTRPALKYQERVTNSLLQVTKQLDAITKLTDSQKYLDEGRNELAILQHHDAITGTSSQKTAEDYYKRLFNATKSCEEVVNRAYLKLLPKEDSNKTANKQIVCDTLNITECSVSENNQNFTLIIYNPIGRAISQWVRVPVNSGHNYEVFDLNGVKVNETYLIPVSQSVLNIPGRKSIAKSELTFKTHLLGVGFVTYFIRKSSKICIILSKNISFKV
jgi:lysosomal alpha-mannosidase